MTQIKAHAKTKWNATQAQMTHDPEEFLAHLGPGHKQLLKDHLLSVSEGTQKRAQKAGLSASGALIGLLHDLGKYSADFQSYLSQITVAQDTEEEKPVRGSVDHSTAGAQTIWRTLSAPGAPTQIARELLALCIASHHSGMIDCIAPDGADKLSQRIDKPDAHSHHEEAWANADPAIKEKAAELLQDPRIVGELDQVTRRIRATDAQDTPRRLKLGLLARFLFSCLIDADRTDTSAACNPTAAALRQDGHYVDWKTLAARLEDYLRGLKNTTPVDVIRQEISQFCNAASQRPKGAFTLTVPTGGGKTLASLRFALHHAAKWKMDRIIYVCPYTSIIDQNASTARRILEPTGSPFASIILEHHSNLTPRKLTWRSKLLSENWDAPVVFTTAVQFLESLFGAGTRPARRMHQLANSVLIFDEIQTLPIRCVHLFNNGLNFLIEQCGATAVLCTATQPLLHRVQATKGALSLHAEIAPDSAALFTRLRRTEARYHAKPGGWEHREAAELADSEAQRAGGCLVVVNTKKEALSIFRECRAISSIPVSHLSTNMCPAHRMKVLFHLKKRLAARKPVICVSTQLIEAGVDISFGSAIRAAAGLDSIAQTAGRCNRNGEAPIGQVHIIELAGGIPPALEEIRAAQKQGLRVLNEYAPASQGAALDPADPAMTEQYFRYHFFDRAKEMGYPVGPQIAGRNDTLLRMLSDNTLAAGHSRSQLLLRQSFMTAAEAFEAIDTNTQGIVVPYMRKGRAIIAALCSTADPAALFVLGKQAQRFTVNVFPQVLEKLNKAGALHETQAGTGIHYLDEKYYNDADFGLNIEGAEEMELQLA